MVRRNPERSRPPASLPPLVPLPAHGTVVLVSDWLDPLDKIEEVVRHYASGGVRGHLVQVLDPAEEDLPFDGHVKFEASRPKASTIRRVETVRVPPMAPASPRSVKACSASLVRPTGPSIFIAPTGRRKRCCCPLYGHG